MADYMATHLVRGACQAGGDDIPPIGAAVLGRGGERRERREIARSL